MFRNSFLSRCASLSRVSIFIATLVCSLIDVQEAYSQCSTPAPAAPSGLTFTATSTVSPAPTTTPTSIASGLVGYWKFDEASGSTACDASGKGNTGTLVNGPLWAVGKVGSALYFDGIDDSVTISDSNSLDVSNSFTLSAWVNPASSFTDFRSILVKNYKYFLYASVAGYCGSGSPLAGFDEQSSNTLCQPSPLPTNAWTHLAATYTGSTLMLYRNGVAVASSNVTKTLSPSTGTLQIGASQFGENFKGLIDEVRVHNRALSNTEIQAIFQQESAVRESGLVAHWKFDEGNGTTASDSSGSANFGILINGPLWTDGKIGKGLYFDGIDDNVTVADSNSLDLSSSFTLSAWVNPASSFTDFRSILVKNYKYFLYASVAGYCGSGSPLAGFDEQTSNTLCQPFPLPTNAWTHLAATYTGSTLNLYRNGVAVVTSSIAKSISPTTGTLQIGASQFGENFKGLIDEVRVHNRAFSNTEIQAIFQQESGGIFSFSVASSGNKTVVAGTSVTNSIAATLDSGTSQAVSFSVSGLPSGATGTFSSASCTPVCSTVLTINTTGSTAAGSFPITVTSIGGGVTRTTAFTLSVTLALTGTGVSAPSTNTGTGVTYYVATNGSNSNSCTDAQNIKTPKLTIAAGIACLQANPLKNRLEIRGGNYGERLRSVEGIVWPQGSNWSNAPIISNYSNETVTLNPSGEEILQIGNNTAYLIFNGIVFDSINNRPGKDPDFGILGGNTTINTGANHIRFTNSEFKNSGGSGMYVEADFLEIINCKFHHNGDTGGDHGIYWSGGNDGLINGSEFYSNSGYGLHVYDGTGRHRPSRNIFRNNFFHSGGTGIIISSDGSDNLVYNNIVMNHMNGIEISYGARYTKVYNNTVFNNNQAGIAIDATVRDSVIRNNILYQNGSSGGIADFGTGMGTVKSNNLTTDPKFVNPAGNDFRLQSLSPAINAGAVLSEVASDFDGRARPQGATYDIGAFEY